MVNKNQSTFNEIIRLIVFFPYVLEQVTLKFNPENSVISNENFLAILQNMNKTGQVERLFRAYFKYLKTKSIRLTQEDLTALSKLEINAQTTSGSKPINIQKIVARMYSEVFEEKKLVLASKTVIDENFSFNPNEIPSDFSNLTAIQQLTAIFKALSFKDKAPNLTSSENLKSTFKQLKIWNEKWYNAAVF